MKKALLVTSLAALAVAPPLTAQSYRQAVGPDLSAGILATTQAETLGYHYHTEGFKVFADAQWRPWLGLDVRGTSVGFGGSDHTYAVEAGPRFTRHYGPVVPYVDLLGGALHQYYFGPTIGAAVGVNVKVYRGVYWMTEGAYRFAPANSTRDVNPREGRIELSTGIRVTILNTPIH